jgi:hypothetical protein
MNNQEQKGAENKVTFLDTLRELKVARKNMCQFVNDNIIMCNKPGNTLPD